MVRAKGEEPTIGKLRGLKQQVWSQFLAPKGHVYPKMHEIWHVCENDKLLGFVHSEYIKALDPVPGH